MKRYKIWSFVLGVTIGLNTIIPVQAREISRTNVIRATTSESFYEECAKLTQQYGLEETKLRELEEHPLKQFETMRLIVKAKNDAFDARQYGAIKVIHGKDNIFIMQFESMEQTDKAYELLSKNNEIEYVEADQYIALEAEVVEVAPKAGNHKSWGVEHIEADQYAQYLAKEQLGNSVTVAVVDSGVDLDHPFLAGRIKEGGKDFVQSDNVPEDEHGHGTHIAGTIVDCTPGLNVDILPIRVLDSDNRGYTIDFVNGIDHAIDKKVDIINFSISVDVHSNYLDNTIKRAISAGIPTVISAGNLNKDTGTQCPAHLADAIIVSAIDSGNNKAYFSNYGASIDIAAPGVNIYNCDMGGNYTYMSGTSMAAPHISAIAAMYKLNNPDLTPIEVEELITTHVQDIGYQGKDSNFGYGVPKLSLALPKFPLESINLEEKITLEKGESRALQVSYNPENTTDDRTVKWTSSNNQIVRVDTSGQLTAVEVGTAVITAQVGEKKAACTVTVTGQSSNANLSNIQISGGKLTTVFYPYTTTYSAQVDFDVDEITITGIPQHEKASVTGPITQKVDTGVTPIELIVTAEDGITKKYIIYVHKGVSLDTDFEFSNGIITKYRGAGGDVIIPESIKGVPVKEIGAYAFNANKNVTSVAIPEGVHTIKNSAFEFCTALMSVDLPSTLKKIELRAFYNCSVLKDIVLPIGLTSIASSAFENCSNLERIEIPETVTTLGSSVFKNCTELKQVTNMNGITNLYSGLFNYCESLTSIEVPVGVKEIGSAFTGCNNLRSITLPSTLEYIDRNAFSGNNSIEEVNLDYGQISLEGKGYKEWKALIQKIERVEETAIKRGSIKNDKERITIKGVNEEETKVVNLTVSTGTLTPAFDPYIQQYSLLVGAEVEVITINAESENGLGYIKGLGSYSLKMGSNDIQIVIVDESSKSKIQYSIEVERQTGILPAPESHFEFSEGVITKYIGPGGEVNIPEQIQGMQVTAIGQSAFENSSTLTKVIIPESVKKIGYNAFRQCTNLTDVIMLSGVEVLDGSTFSECISLTNVILPDTLKKIYSHTFYKCTSLEQIEIPNSVDELGNQVFRECTALTNVKLPDKLTKIEYMLFRDCKNLEYIEIPDSVTYIRDAVFQDCIKLKEVKFPSKLTKMDHSVLSGCTAIKEVILPDTLEQIPPAFFMGLSNLKQVKLPNGLKTVRYSLFADCIGLENIELPDTIQVIENEAFKGCTQLKSVELPKQLNKIDYRAFQYCSSLSSIKLQENCQINFSAFSNCDGLNYVELPKNTVNISRSVFDYSDNIERIDINYGEESIGDVGYNEWKNTVNQFTNESTVKIGYIFNKHESKQVKKASDANLISLSVNEGTLTPSFKPEILTYEVKVGYEVESITIRASAQDLNARVEGIGKKDLIVGENIFNILVIAEDGITQKVYTLQIKRLEQESPELAPENHFKFENGTITGYTGPGGYIVIPSRIGGQAVTEIGREAFIRMDSITGIVIPEGVTTIGNSAFYQCNNLKEVTVPEGVEVINHSTFSSCANLVTVNLPKSIKNIEYYAFTDSKNLQYINLPEGLTHIGTAAFMRCNNLREVIIPESIEVLSNSAFYECDSLETIKIPEKLMQIGTNAFEKCINVRNITLSYGERTIDRVGYNEWFNFVTGKMALDEKSITNGYISNNKELRQVKGDQSNNTYLSNILLSEGELKPEFNPLTMSYDVSVGYDIINVEIQATPLSKGATIEGTGIIQLNPGINSIELVVTSSDRKTVKIYRINLIRTQSNNAELNDLSINKGTLSPAFNPATTKYSVAVNNEVSAINVAATTADATAKVEGTGTHSLEVGLNAIQVVVTAQDGSKNIYTVVIYREYQDEDINQDNTVDYEDLDLIADKHNTTSSDSEWDQSLDLNEDGIVDIFDLIMVGNKFNN